MDTVFKYFIFSEYIKKNTEISVPPPIQSLKKSRPESGEIFRVRLLHPKDLQYYFARSDSPKGSDLSHSYQHGWRQLTTFLPDDYYYVRVMHDIH